MTLKLNGTNSVAAPAYAGDDADTGLQCGTNELKLVTGGTARATVDSSGRLLAGTTSARTNVYSSALNITPQNQFESNFTNYQGGLSLINNSASGHSPVLTFGQSYTNTLGGNGLTPNNEPLGILNFTANDGSNFRTAATIQAFADGTTGSGDVPGRLAFYTTADGASSPTERLRITSDGTIRLASGCPGIDFSQIQTNASGMTSETLDSYEEGTWTPSLGLGTGSFNSDSWGRYTRIGRRVHLNCFIKIGSSPAMNNTTTLFLVAGVPFTPVDPGSGGFVGSIMCNDFAWRTAGGVSDATMVTPYITDGTGGIRIYGQKNNGGWDSLKCIDFNTNEQFYCQISYDVS